ncbi:MAG: PepSY domain-containing protein [Pseudomonadota bacterium]
MIKRLSLAAALLLASAGMVSPAVSAQGYGSSFDAGEAREAVKDGRTVPLARIRQQLQGRYGGSMTDANLYSRGNGKSEYTIKWIDRDGRRMIIVVDAQSGRVIRENRG